MIIFQSIRLQLYLILNTYPVHKEIMPKVVSPDPKQTQLFLNSRKKKIMHILG